MNLSKARQMDASSTMLSLSPQICDRIWSSIKNETSLHWQEPEDVTLCDETDNMPITTISVNGEQKNLSCPVLLSITKEGGEYIAENTTLNIVAVGETKDLAIREAEMAIAAEYNFYASKPTDALIGLALKLKTAYSSLFL